MKILTLPKNEEVVIVYDEKYEKVYLLARYPNPTNDGEYLFLSELPEEKIIKNII